MHSNLLLLLIATDGPAIHSSALSELTIQLDRAGDQGSCFLAFAFKATAYNELEPDSL